MLISLAPAIRRAIRAIAPLALAACASLPIGRASRAERWGVAVPWDARSSASATAHAAALDLIVTGWIALDTLTGQPGLSPIDSVPRTQPSMRRMAVVTSLADGRPQPAVVRRLALDTLALRRSALAIAAQARRGAYQGLLIDFQGLAAADSLSMRVVVAAITRAARAANVAPIAISIPAADTAAYPARLFDDVADLLVVMLSEQHWPSSPPGPVATPDWVRRTLGMRVAERGATRLVAALPLHGYLWRPNTIGTAITVDDARRLAAEAGTALTRDPATRSLHATRTGTDGWELWVSDAELVTALERGVIALGVRRIAFWRLGLEDPAMWTTHSR